MDVVFTDLDGTLLDHSTYSFEAAQPALHLLSRRSVPVIVCTSKTRKEVEFWRRRLNNPHPFIVENGGAAFFPADAFPFSVEESTPCEHYRVLAFGTAYADLVNALRDAAEESRCRVLGFHQMSVAEVSRRCEMPSDEAALAKEREFDEPFLLLEPKREAELLAAIERRGKRWTRGGRFYHIVGANDKATAVRRLLGLYRRVDPAVRSIGLGDGLNDAPFLNEVDLPILIRTAWLERLHQLVPRGTPTRSPGPEGWNQAILGLYSA